MNSTLPALKIVAVKSLLLHEFFDQKRVLKLKRKIPQDGIFTNPPIVAKIPMSKKYVVLDGANRVTVVKELKIPHLVVQIIDYFKEAKLETWNHLLCSNKNNREIVRIVNSNSLYVKVKKRKVINFLKVSTKNLENNIDLLNRVYNLYKDSKFYRVLGSNLKELEKEYGSFNLLLVYPKFSPAEIIDIVNNNFKIPSGITRHLLNNRAIGIDLDLKILTSKCSLTDKNRYLNKIILERAKNNKIRVYQEPIVVLND